MLLTPEVKVWLERTDYCWGMFSFQRAWEARDIRPILGIFQREWFEVTKERLQFGMPIWVGDPREQTIVVALPRGSLVYQVQDTLNLGSWLGLALMFLSFPG